MPGGARRVFPAVCALLCACVAVGCSMSSRMLPRSARVLAPSPAVGWSSGGTAVRLVGAEGMRFGAAVRVTFDGVAAESATVDADGLVVIAVTPAHATGAVDVRVVVSAGTPYERRFTLPAAFTYVPSGRVDTVEPSLARDDGGSVVRVLGSGFQPSITAHVDGQVAELERVSAGELLVTMPPHAPGVAELSLVNMPGSPIEDSLPPSPVTYLARDYRYHLLISARLVDVMSGVILHAGLFHGVRAVTSPVDVPEEALLASLGGEFVAGLPLQLVDRGRDTIRVVDASAEDTTSSERALFGSVLSTLAGRGYSATRLALEGGGAAADGPFAFYLSPSLTVSGAPSDAADAIALATRVVVAQVVDHRRRRIQPDAERPPAERWVDTLPERFEELRFLAALTPVSTPASTVMVVRSPVDVIEGMPTAWDYVTEDAIVAGLSSRLRVIAKTDGPLVRPDWAMVDTIGLPDGLAYTSWSEFRRGNRQVESLMLYRPDERGFYGRLVDTATGLALWSARSLPARYIFSGLAGETTYDRAESLLETQPWYTWIPDGARVALVATMPAGADPDGWRAEAVLAQDGLISALTRSGVAVTEPMVVLYAGRDPSPGRTIHSEPPYASDPWRELRLAGATHILEFDVAPGGAETPMSWDFRLLNAADGSVNTQFAASEAGVEGQNVAP